ncbi:MAG: class I SAM-dependent methyltransferase [Acidobacteriia bacterium]|nr:class I SAM-dependent methyltransferase [Terriglobia bacterium]
MPFFSDIAREKKCRFFLDPIPKGSHVLEVGCGFKWVGEYLKAKGHQNYIGLDLFPPADIVGNIKDWRTLGLREESFDFIVAFEVLEHEPCAKECFDLLKPGGKLLATSPVPSMDWVMKTFELCGLNQPRTSPHDHLVDFRTVSHFELTSYRRIAGLSQWGIFTRQPRS